MKAIVWIGSSKKDLQHVFSESALKEAGYQIDRIQMGVDPKNWKPMLSVVPEVRERWIHAESDYRVRYIAGFGEALFILHSLAKKTQKTPERDLDLVRERFELVVKGRGS